MLNLHKYKLNFFLITENTISLKIKNNPNKKLFFNYLFKMKIKIIRVFIHFYSIFLCNMQYNPYIYKNQLKYEIKINNTFFLILENDYDSFFI